jgi:hypothetical protein
VDHVLTHRQSKKIPIYGNIHNSELFSSSLLLTLSTHSQMVQMADGITKTAQTALPRSKAKEVLAELHGGLSGGHLGVNKTLNKVRQRHYWLHS